MGQVVVTTSGIARDHRTLGLASRLLSRPVWNPQRDHGARAGHDVPRIQSLGHPSMHGREPGAVASLKPMQEGCRVKQSRRRQADQSEAAGPRSGDYAVGGKRWRH